MPLLAPLIHGRTLHLDFRTRFIASPEDFDEAAVAWARSRILAMTSPSVLYKLEEDGLWWSVFSNERHTVSGVLCRAYLVSNDCNSDGSRRLYTYLGVVARNPVTVVPAMSLEHFAPLYQYVRDRWEESSAEQLSASRPVSYRDVDIPQLSGSSQHVELNRNSDAIALWPMEDKEAVWRWAHESAGASAVVGAPFAGEIKKGAFANVCSGEITARRCEALPQPKPRPQPSVAVGPGPSSCIVRTPSPLYDAKKIFSKACDWVQKKAEHLPVLKRVVKPGKEVLEVWQEEWSKWEREEEPDCLKVFAIVPGSLKPLEYGSPGAPGTLFQLFWNVLFESLDFFEIDDFEIGEHIRFCGSLNPADRVTGVITTMPGFSGCCLAFSGPARVNREKVRKALNRALYVLVEQVHM